MAFRLKVAFLGIGFRWPLRAEDTIEIWSDDHECVGTMSGGAMIMMVQHHVATAALQAAITQDIRRPLAPSPPKIPGRVRAERRSERRRRKS
jgi:hypothetical protein